MTFNAAYGTDTTSGKTRGYNGNIGGTTFRMAPGETLEITLVNSLLAERSVDCTTTGTEYCKASNTNLHTHGLHVSSLGTNDGLSYNSGTPQLSYAACLPLTSSSLTLHPAHPQTHPTPHQPPTPTTPRPVHPSPLSPPADNIFADIEPGASGDFKFSIPSYHMAGTHW